MKVLKPVVQDILCRAFMFVLFYIGLILYSIFFQHVTKYCLRCNSIRKCCFLRVILRLLFTWEKQVLLMFMLFRFPSWCLICIRFKRFSISIFAREICDCRKSESFKLRPLWWYFTLFHLVFVFCSLVGS